MATAARYRLEAELRHGGWRFVVVAALVLGVGGGAALAALAGARRTDTAFDRLLDETRGADVVLAGDVRLINAVDERVLDAAPEVTAHARSTSIPLLDPANPNDFISVTAPLDDRFGVSIERPLVREGRYLDPSRTDELFANPEGARDIGLDVGEQIELRFVPLAVLRDTPDREMHTVGEVRRYTLVGIGVVPVDVVERQPFPTVYATRAFADEFGGVPLDATADFFGTIAVDLADGEADVDAFVETVRTRAPRTAAIELATSAQDAATIDRGLRPQILALHLFAATLAIGTMAAAAQMTTRRARADDAVDETLQGLGMTKRDRRRLPLLRLLVVALVGWAVAVVVAMAASALFPVGLARPIEPDRGIEIDAVVVLGGSVAFIAIAFALAFVMSAVRRRPTASRHDPGVVARVLAAGRLPVPMSTGMRVALQSSTASRGGAMRSTIIAATVGVTSVVAALTFAHSLDRFISSPARFGWDFDAVLYPGPAAEHSDVMTFAVNLNRLLTEEAGVAGYTELPVQQVRIEGLVVPSIGIGENGGTAPGVTILDGREPAATDEVALGRVTMRDTGLAIGDEVELGDPPHPYRVVGTVVLPTLTTGGATDHAALGSGALFLLAGLEAATSADLSLEATSLIPPIAIDLAPGASVPDLQRHLDENLEPGVMEVRPPFLTGDTAGYAGVRFTPLVLAAILAVLAGVTVGHALVLVVRSRRRDFAVLRSLGITRRQVISIVLWSSSTVALLATVIGVPIGALLGRLSWASVTDRLGIADITGLPTLALSLTLPIAVAMACCAALVPVVIGIRQRPAAVLRAE